MNKLIRSNKIEIKKSKIEGYGVFATEFIYKDEILEEVPFVIFKKHYDLNNDFNEFCNKIGYSNDLNNYSNNLIENLGFKNSDNYFFQWTPLNPNLNNQKITFKVIPLGVSCLYNNSNSKNNAKWKINGKIFTFSTTKEILPGEEILVFYGYFVDDNSTHWPTNSVFNLALELIDSKPYLCGINFSNNILDESIKNDPNGYGLIQKNIDKYQKLKFHKIYYENSQSCINLDSIDTTNQIYRILSAYKSQGKGKVKIIFKNDANEEKIESTLNI